jgi:hypothetical protein
MQCCAPAATTTAQTWPSSAHVTVNIDPSFNTAQRTAIVQSFQNWQAAGSLNGNGSGVVFTFTYNASPPSMSLRLELTMPKYGIKILREILG